MKLRKIVVNMSRLIPDSIWLRLLFKKKIGKRLELNNPVTFNEKIQWLKLYNRNPIHVQMVDKECAKAYAAKIIGEDYIIPTLQVRSRFEDIDFANLPEKFVIKCTHDSGGLCICTDKKSFDFVNAKKKINESLKRNYYLDYREWPYKYVKPRIIVEQYIVDEEQKELRDYKFFCFGGKVKFFKIDFDRFTSHKANYYDTDLNLLPFGEACCPPDYNRLIIIPIQIKAMISLAEKLAVNEPFVRVDLYCCNSNIYFGEMTFYPASGLGKFIPEEWDERLGKEIILPPRIIK